MYIELYQNSFGKIPVLIAQSKREIKQEILYLEKELKENALAQLWVEHEINTRKNVLEKIYFLHEHALKEYLSKRRLRQAIPQASSDGKKKGRL